MKRTFSLKKETLAELSSGDLAAVRGAAILTGIYPTFAPQDCVEKALTCACE